VRVILLLKEDERDQVIILNSIVAQAKEAIEKMVPPKIKIIIYYTKRSTIGDKLLWSSKSVE
jgi:hypothetical protein